MLRSDGPGRDVRAAAASARSNVAAFARNLDVTYRVWSPTGGYPGNKWYREYFAYDMTAGFKNWRVTSIHTPIAGKKPYDPARGVERAAKDAEDFVALLDDSLTEHEERTGSEGIVVACYDTELFGHWWFEGPAFLENVYALLEDHPRISPMSLGRALEEVPPDAHVELAEGSWGFRKDLRSWIAPETEEMWRALAETESETVRIARKFAGRRARRRSARSRSSPASCSCFSPATGRSWCSAARTPATRASGSTGIASDGRASPRRCSRRMPAAPLDRLTAELAELDNAFPGPRLQSVQLVGPRPGVRLAGVAVGGQALRLLHHHRRVGAVLRQPRWCWPSV